MEEIDTQPIDNELTGRLDTPNGLSGDSISNNDDNEDNDDNKKRYRKLRKKLKSLKRNIIYFSREQVNDVWYPADFFIDNGYIPVIKGTLEYSYLIEVARPHFSYRPKLILKRNRRRDTSDNNDNIEYTFFGQDCLPFKLKLKRSQLPIEEISLLAMPDTDLFIFTDNLLKS